MSPRFVEVLVGFQGSPGSPGAPAAQAMVDLPVALTVAIGEAEADYIRLTGSGTIESFGTAVAGVERTVLFQGAVTLIKNDSFLIPPYGADYVTSPGEGLIFRNEGGTVWRAIAGIPGNPDFLDLTDTPDTYAGQALKIVRVNAGPNGLEFHTLTAADIANIPSGALFATNVQAALNELDGDLTSGLAGKQNLASNLTALAGVATTGIYVRTGTSTATVRSIAGTAPIVVTNGSGVGGNPTVSVTDGTFPLAKLPNMSPGRVLGNPGPASGPPVEVRIGSGLHFRDSRLRVPAPPDYFGRNMLTQQAWAVRTAAADNQWYGIAESPDLGLLVAVGITGTGNRVMTSRNGGLTWTIGTCPDQAWRAVEWAATCANGLGGYGLFVAVSSDGVGTRVMTSPDGLTWTLRTSAADLVWRTLCWAPEAPNGSGGFGLFVAMADSGTNNRIMTSPDGVTWTTRTAPQDLAWQSVCWSPQERIFCAVAVSGTGTRVGTSSDGVTWTIQTTPADNNWTSVCWAAECPNGFGGYGLFVAVASSGTGNRVMTSHNGSAWVIGVSPADNSWVCVIWAPEVALFIACASSGTLTRLMTSPDGKTWTTRNNSVDNSWRTLWWSSIMRLAVCLSITGTGNRVITVSDVFGLYIPTAVAVLNVAAVTSAALIWSRVGNMVNVAGKINADPTAAGQAQVRLPLPLTSVVSDDAQVAGVGAAKAVAGMSVAILGDTVNNAALFEWVAVDTAARDIHFTFFFAVR